MSKRPHPNTCRSLICLLFTLLLFSSCSAQKSVFTRISSAERSDGEGYVVRFHLNNEADSFAVAQPLPDLVQLAIFGPDINTDEISQTVSATFQNIKIYPLTHGVGIVFKIKSESYYRAQAYPDGASNDLLLALTETPRTELISQLKSENALAWAPKIEKSIDIEKGTDVEPAKAELTSFNKLREKLELDVIVLDAGHGGHDPGATSYHGVYEKKIVLAITKKVGNYIEKYMPEVKVVYTRDSDYFVGLKERGHIANRASGDLFVSIHANAAASSRARGTEVYFLGLERSRSALEVMQRENNVVALEDGPAKAKITQQELFIYELANSANIKASEKLAGMIRHQFKERALRRSRGVKQARFVVLYYASMPAVLVETGFVTNPDEGAYLTSDYGQAIIASAIFRAIRDYKQQFAKSQGFTEE